jgi:hypothetical protein
MKKTEWFDGEITPVRIGFYEVTEPKGHSSHGRWRGFQYWNGDHWEQLTFYAVPSGGKSIYQNHCWRGLTEKAS